LKAENADVSIPNALEVGTVVAAESFQSGKFRLRATTLSLNIERYDDDGDTISDSWQRIAAFNWGDTSGSVICNSIRASDQSYVAVNDDLEVQYHARVGGSLTAGAALFSGVTTGSLKTTLIEAPDGNGTGLLTSGGQITFAAQGDRNCKAFGNLEVANNLFVGGAIESDTLRPKNNPGVTVASDLHVEGNISFGSIVSPFWAAGKVDGNTLAILSSKGQSGFSVVRESGFGTGVYKIRFNTPHPDGADYVTLITSLFTINYLTPAPFADNGSSNFTLTLKNNGNSSLADDVFHFMVLR
jgi:hypothetical protein